ncbi:MAG: pyridoxamine 5'-phosphate oxidase family protein [Anaerolineae bacterium]|nr:pyridoxamine 5'-phosphate oxidase family protein [Anaerolineae bacterium]
MAESTLYTTFSPDDIQALEPALKIGILATVNDNGLPHLTLISSLKANTSTQMTWGQFTEGLSKSFIRTHPKVGWLIMTLDKQLWRGKAAFTHTAQTGPEFEAYNNVPMFRYNAYFGIHTVYYMDLVEHSGRQPLPMGQVVLAAVRTMFARTLPAKRAAVPVLNPWTRALMNKLDNLKFLSYIGADGYPLVIPAIQAQAAGAGQILFSTGAYRDDLEAIPPGATVAVFCMSLSMEDVLMRGKFQGVRRVAGIRCGRIAVDWVYNPMPPTPQQIYPRVAVEPVTAF